MDLIEAKKDEILRRIGSLTESSSDLERRHTYYYVKNLLEEITSTEDLKEYVEEFLQAPLDVDGGRHSLLEMVTVAHKKDGIGVILRIYNDHFPPHIHVDSYSGKTITKIELPLRRPVSVSDVRSIDRHSELSLKFKKNIFDWFQRESKISGKSNWLYCVWSWNQENCENRFQIVPVDGNYEEFELKEASIA